MFGPYCYILTPLGKYQAFPLRQGTTEPSLLL